MAKFGPKVTTRLASFERLLVRYVFCERKHRKRLDEMLGIITNELQTVYGVASQMTWDIDCDSWDDFPRAQKWFATGEAIAHLRYLQSEGSILQRDENALIVFSSKN